jgi:hypothetical protein
MAAGAFEGVPRKILKILGFFGKTWERWAISDPCLWSEYRRIQLRTAPPSPPTPLLQKGRGENIATGAQS